MKRIKIPAKTNLSKWAPFDQSSQGSEATGPTAQKTFDTSVVQFGGSYSSLKDMSPFGWALKYQEDYRRLILCLG